MIVFATAFLALAAQDAQPVQPGQPQSDQSAPSTFTTERLEQLVAPIALYPDALLTQILMASTYPLEIVQAERWVEANPGLKGTALEEALKAEDWDPSVKVLCGLPTVLKKMNDELDWTRDLGDAFLSQKADVMDTVQRMRKKALDAGSLKTTEQQKVTQDQDVVVIEPASPDVVYVPSYSPLVVYGPGWYYPYWYYPYWYYPPPPGAGFVSFGFGFFWGYPFWGWGHCDWHHHDVFVDVVRFQEFHRATSVGPAPRAFQGTSGQVAWQHDPVHRQGVNYRSARIAQSFGAAPGTSRVIRDRARGFDRGFDRSSPSLRPPAAQSAPLPQKTPDARPPASAPRSEPARPPADARSHPAPRSSPSPTPPPRTFAPSARSAFSGYRAPAFDRSASGRGAMSRARSSAMSDRRF